MKFSQRFPTWSLPSVYDRHVFSTQPVMKIGRISARHAIHAIYRPTSRSISGSNNPRAAFGGRRKRRPLKITFSVFYPENVKLIFHKRPLEIKIEMLKRKRKLFPRCSRWETVRWATFDLSFEIFRFRTEKSSEKLRNFRESFPPLFKKTKNSRTKLMKAENRWHIISQAHQSVNVLPGLVTFRGVDN